MIRCSTYNVAVQAPYREPKLPPPDFVPTEHGVGVPLPPEEEDEFYGGGRDGDEYEYVYEDDDEETNEISDERGGGVGGGPLSVLPPPLQQFSGPVPGASPPIRFSDGGHIKKFDAAARKEEEERGRFLFRTSGPDSFSYNYVSSTTTPRPPVTPSSIATAKPSYPTPAPSPRPIVTPKANPFKNYVSLSVAAPLPIAPTPRPIQKHQPALPNRIAGQRKAGAYSSSINALSPPTDFPVKDPYSTRYVRIFRLRLL